MFLYIAIGFGIPIEMNSYQQRPEQQFHFEGKKIVNTNGDCIDIRGSSQANRAEIISYKFYDTPSQRWRTEYL